MYHHVVLNVIEIPSTWQLISHWNGKYARMLDERAGHGPYEYVCVCVCVWCGVYVCDNQKTSSKKPQQHQHVSIYTTQRAITARKQEKNWMNEKKKRPLYKWSQTETYTNTCADTERHTYRDVYNVLYVSYVQRNHALSFTPWISFDCLSMLFAAFCTVCNLIRSNECWWSWAAPAICVCALKYILIVWKQQSQYHMVISL